MARASRRFHAQAELVAAVQAMGSVYEVNSAHVVCGIIQTANATIYVISKVLIPMH